MSKPEDISQEAWDASIKALWTDAMHEGECPEWMETQVALVARAILAAKAEEREACAQVCDAEVEGALSLSPKVTEAEKLMGRRIASIIRKRGEG